MTTYEQDMIICRDRLGFSSDQILTDEQEEMVHQFFIHEMMAERWGVPCEDDAPRIHADDDDDAQGHADDNLPLGEGIERMSHLTDEELDYYANGQWEELANEFKGSKLEP